MMRTKFMFVRDTQPLAGVRVSLKENPAESWITDDEGKIELDLPEKPGAPYTLNALWRRDARPGPATSWLVDAVRERLGECPVGAAVNSVRQRG